MKGPLRRAFLFASGYAILRLMGDTSRADRVPYLTLHRLYGETLCKGYYNGFHYLFGSRNLAWGLHQRL